MDTILRDVRVGLRALRRAPMSTAVVVISLALGVGANTAIYSLAHATLLRPLDLPALDRLFVLSKIVDGRADSLTAGDALRIESSIGDLASVSTIGWTAATTSIAGRKERVGVRFAAPELVDVIGIAPQRGRWFTPDETSRGAGVGVINDWMWRARFGADPDVLGRTVVINDTDITIVGVLPPSFRLEAAPERSDVVTVPLSLHGPLVAAHGDAPALLSGPPDDLTIVLRLPDGGSRDALEARLAVLSRQLAETTRPADAVALVAVPAADAAVPPYARQTVRRLLGLLGGTALLILLLGCASLTAMLLARAEDRRREIAMRTALGASRWRVVRQLLTEASLLAILAAALGFIVALGYLRLFGEFALWGMSDVGALAGTPDRSVLVVGVGLALLVTVASALAPALHATGSDVARAVHGTSDRRSRRLQTGLLALQVAIALVLLTGATLLTRSVHRGLTVDLGFADDRLLEVLYDLDRTRWTRERHYDFRRALVERVRRLPGVVAAGVGESPLIAFDATETVFVNGRAPDDRIRVRVVHADHDYREAVGLPLLAGRDLTAADDWPSHRPTAVVNAAFAERFFRDGAALGHSVRRAADPNAPEFLIVGIVGNSRFSDLRSVDRPTIYVPRESNPAYPLGGTLIVRTAGPSAPLAGQVTRAFRELAPDDLPPWVTQTSASHRAGLFAGQRAGATLLWSFGLLGLTLAVIGVAGSVLYAIRRRRTELGVRLALGASPSRLVRHAMAIGLRPVLVGLPLGLVAAWWTSRLLRPFLFEIPSRDLASFGAACVVLVLTGVLAAALPARRVRDIDPAMVLRAE
jgi:putative ABC transport system permease protein